MTERCVFPRSPPYTLGNGKSGFPAQAFPARVGNARHQKTKGLTLNFPFSHYVYG